MGSPGWLLEVSSGPVEDAQRALSFFTGSPPGVLAASEADFVSNQVFWGGWGLGIRRVAIKVCVATFGRPFSC